MVLIDSVNREGMQVSETSTSGLLIMIFLLSFPFLFSFYGIFRIGITSIEIESSHSRRVVFGYPQRIYRILCSHYCFFPIFFFLLPYKSLSRLLESFWTAKFVLVIMMMMMIMMCACMCDVGDKTRRNRFAHSRSHRLKK